MATTATSERRLDYYERFVGHIVKVCREQPGRRSALRRGVGKRPDQAHEMHAIIAPWLRTVDPAGRHDIDPEEYALYSVAAMIATQTGSGRNPTGDASAGAKAEEESQSGEESSEESEVSGGAARTRRPTLGTALALAVRREHPTRRAIGEEAAEKRLHLLVRQNLHGVHRQLPRVVRHIGQLNVPVDWAQLINDLRRWTPNDQRSVAKVWLQDFYRNLHPDQEETS